jgi:hypothetical protein
LSHLKRIWTKKRVLTAQIALIALIFNAIGQVQCCVGAFPDGMAKAMQAGGMQSGAFTANCHTDGQDSQVEKTTANRDQLTAVEALAEASGQGTTGNPEDHGHGDHSSGGCDCTDGVCGQALVALADFHKGPVFAAAGSDFSEPGVAPGMAGYQYTEFSARAPPHILS